MIWFLKICPFVAHEYKSYVGQAELRLRPAAVGKMLRLPCKMLNCVRACSSTTHFESTLIERQNSQSNKH